ncbi:alkaline phosphatase [Alteromonas ponticola]|uniref:Alkaline phosphatase n=1 Tax=Alteromonas aquimaris TaxID=2998417 RepID=A0ABT3P9T5_9ALTE|nr:alkaline phosphatase [Alteromonas aquimaris]MCW8109543.1 alkaline phosphatase [Alteromonas aquimaris]
MKILLSTASVARGYRLLAVILVCGLVACNDENSAVPFPTHDDVEPAKTKHVILMIADGASDGTWDVASYWSHGQALNKVKPYSEFPTRLAMTTYALWQRSTPVSCTQKKVQEDGYEAEKAWDTSPIYESQPREGSGPDSPPYIRPFAGYSYLNRNYTDSAAAATAFATGQKTYIGALGGDYCGKALTNIVSIASAENWGTGLVSSVPFNHATPAGFTSHNISRTNYHDIAHEILSKGELDIIIGAGHPFYTNDNEVRETPVFNYISPDDFAPLARGEFVAHKRSHPWLLIEHLHDFAALAAGDVSSIEVGQPVLGLVQVSSTLQARRACSMTNPVAFACPFNTDVPSLSTLAKGALNVLSRHDKGFFVMIEGGAVDWAAHANNLSGIIEEQIAFNEAVATVVKWVEDNSNWQETLLIVTTDHGNAFVLGEDSALVPFANVRNPGIYAMPRVKFYSQNHTNELVRLYAKGSARAEFEQYIDGVDLLYKENYNHLGTTGEFIDNTAIFKILRDIIEQR